MLVRAVIENIRKQQSVIEEARAIDMALNIGETKEEVANQLGMSIATVNSRLSLLELPPKKQQAIHAGKASVKSARAEHAESNGKPVVTPLRKRKEIEAAMDEFAEGRPERRVLEWMLGLREKIA